jgi:hypothetical protein
MQSKFERPLRLFVVNPFAIWADVALKAGQAMWSSYADAARDNDAPKVAVIPTRVAVIPTADAPAPVARRAKPARAKLRSKRKAGTKAKRRAKR